MGLDPSTSRLLDWRSNQICNRTDLIVDIGVLSHNPSYTPGLAPLMNVLSGGRCEFLIRSSGRDVKERLKSSLRKFYCRYGDLIKQYDAHLPVVTRHSWGWPNTMTPFIDQTLHQFLTLLLIWTLLPNLTFYLIVRGFHRTFATGGAC